MNDIERHMVNVAKYSFLVGKELNLDKQDLIDLSVAARFHDIGKYSIPKIILYKKQRLTELERKIIQSHPVTGAEILRDKGFKGKIVDAVLHHHERYDGKGYPDNISGESIPLFARIITITDSFDAMVTDRPYKRALTFDEAIQEIMSNINTQFDPGITPIFKNIIEINNKFTEYSSAEIV